MTGKKEAGDIHFQVGQKVRETIADLGGVMPEDLSTPEKSIKQIIIKKSNKLTSLKFK